MTTAEAIPAQAASQVEDFSSLPDEALLKIDPRLLVDAPWGNMRTKRTPAKFDELKQSVASSGIFQNVVGRPDPNNPAQIQLLAGYGRRDAALDVGISPVPLLLRHVDDRAAKAIMLAENASREDLNAVVLIENYAALVGNFDGDYETASEFLGISQSKLRRYVQLMNCIPAVREALAEDGIQLGHAELLSQLADNKQQDLLDRTILEKLSIKDLKEACSQTQIDLELAKFDKTDCQQCPSNSEIQRGLFDNGVGGGKCGNAGCFKAKSKAWYEDHIAELAADHNKVIGEHEKPANERRLIDVTLLGEDQVANGCAGCVDNAIIVSTKLSTLGDTTADQCVNLECFEKCQTAFAKANGQLDQSEIAAAMGAPAPAAAASTGTAKSAPATTAKPAAQKAEGSLPSSVRNRHAYTARTAMVTHINANAKELNTSIAIAVAALATSLTATDLEKLKFPSPGNCRSFVDSFAVASEMTVADLRSWHSALIGAWVEVGDMGNNRDALHEDRFQNALLATLRDRESLVDDLIAAWVPSEDTLKHYTKAHLQTILTQPTRKGLLFAESYEAVNGEKSFKKLMALKSKERLAAILAFEDFDWENFAPEVYLKDLGIN